MTFYGAKELAAAFRTVRRNTIRIAEEIPEDKYGFRPAGDCRTLGETLAHIALLAGFQSHVHRNRIDDLAKVNFPEFIARTSAEEATPRSKAELIALLEKEGEAFASYLEGLSDSFLAERVTMPPGGEVPNKSRFEMLLSVKEHEMHHRGQLMMMQRMIGQVPHLTRQRQERFAARAGAAAGAQAQPAR